MVLLSSLCVHVIKQNVTTTGLHMPLERCKKEFHKIFMNFKLKEITAYGILTNAK
jgi:hypothetical protein